MSRTVVLGNEGIQILRDYFNTMENELEGAVTEMEQRIAQRGKEELDATAPTHSVDGNQTGSVFVENSADGIRVVYAGKDVAYIEFGTGYIGENNPYPNEITLNKVDWVYDSNEHGYGGWVYKRKEGDGYRHSRGMAPEAPVLTAFTRTKKVVPQIVKEVMDERFGN